jgi:hypothetical protein
MVPEMEAPRSIGLLIVTDACARLRHPAWRVCVGCRNFSLELEVIYQLCKWPTVRAPFFVVYHEP